MDPRPAPVEQPPAKPLFWALAFLLLFAPLMRGGNRPLPLLILELGTLGLMLAALWTGFRTTQVAKGPLLVLVALLVLPLLYLLPMPGPAWAALPGHGLYQDVLALASGDTKLGWRPASLFPRETEIAWFALLLPLGVFFAASALPSHKLFQLTTLLLALAALQAALGLIQYGDGADSVFRFGAPATDTANGTYVNRNHLAGFLEMALPVGLALMAVTVGRSRGTKRQHRRGWRSRISFWSSLQGNQTLAYGALAALILVGLVFTRSRTGIVLGMLGIALSTIAFARRLGGTNVYGTIGTLTSVCTGVALLVGLAPILERFALLEPSTIDRLLIYDTTLAGVARFLPWGSGPGTYPDIYPLFQPVYSVGFTNHAHNDYLELMFEMGLPGTALVVTMLLLYARQWSKVWVPGNWTTFRAAQVGAGIGVLLMALHSLTDFNQHIPANTVFLAFLAAVFWHRPAVEETGQGTRQRKSTNGRSPPSAQSSPATRPGVTGPAPASQPQVVPTRNPFMD